MRVSITREIDGRFRAAEVVEVPDDEAATMIRNGEATPHQEVPPAAVGIPAIAPASEILIPGAKAAPEEEPEAETDEPKKRLHGGLGKAN